MLIKGCVLASKTCERDSSVTYPSKYLTWQALRFDEVGIEG